MSTLAEVGDIEVFFRYLRRPCRRCGHVFTHGCCETSGNVPCEDRRTGPRECLACGAPVALPMNQEVPDGS